jgi:hypothetical protein
MLGGNIVTGMPDQFSDLAVSIPYDFDLTLRGLGKEKIFLYGKQLHLYP